MHRVFKAGPSGFKTAWTKQLYSERSAHFPVLNQLNAPSPPQSALSGKGHSHAAIRQMTFLSYAGRLTMRDRSPYRLGPPPSTGRALNRGFERTVRPTGRRRFFSYETPTTSGATRRGFYKQTNRSNLRFHSDAVHRAHPAKTHVRSRHHLHSDPPLTTTCQAQF